VGHQLLEKLSGCMRTHNSIQRACRLLPLIFFSCTIYTSSASESVALYAQLTSPPAWRKTLRGGNPPVLFITTKSTTIKSLDNLGIKTLNPKLCPNYMSSIENSYSACNTTIHRRQTCSRHFGQPRIYWKGCACHLKSGQAVDRHRKIL
jgi:hypothetical protein